MSNSTIRGIVHLIEDTKTFGQKGFRKRLVVLEQNTGRFTSYIPLEFIGDDCDSADALNVGEKVRIHTDTVDEFHEVVEHYENLGYHIVEYWRDATGACTAIMEIG